MSRVVEQFFLTVPRGCLQFVIVVFPDHTHLLFLMFFLFWNVKNVKVDLMVNVKMATLSAKCVLKNA